MARRIAPIKTRASRQSPRELVADFAERLRKLVPNEHVLAELNEDASYKSTLAAADLRRVTLDDNRDALRTLADEGETYVRALLLAKDLERIGSELPRAAEGPKKRVPKEAKRFVDRLWETLHPPPSERVRELMFLDFLSKFVDEPLEHYREAVAAWLDTQPGPKARGEKEKWTTLAKWMTGMGFPTTGVALKKEWYQHLRSRAWRLGMR